MSRGPWKKNQEENLEKQAEKAEGIVTTISLKKEEKQETLAVQDISSGEKKKLPKIIISTYNKKGDQCHICYTCAKININKDEQTVLEDGSPTRRKDYVHLTLEADVVGIE